MQSRKKILLLAVALIATATTADRADAARQAKNSRLNKPGSRPVKEGDSVRLKTSHWRVGLPALPVQQSDVIVVGEVINAQEQEVDKRADIGSWACEYNARHWATVKVLPIYPTSAIEKGVTGIVEVIVGWDDKGEVIKVKVPPGLNQLLGKATVAAARQWQFRPRLNQTGITKYHINRLSFNFTFEGGKAQVELYEPPWDSNAAQRMRSGIGTIDDWKKWEEAAKETQL